MKSLILNIITISLSILSGCIAAKAQSPAEIAEKAMEGYRLFVRDSLCDDRLNGYGMMLEAAWEGDAKAANNIGWLKMTGNFTEKDEAAALRWFQRSATQGLPAGAMNYIDLILERPELAVSADSREALAQASGLAANALMMGRGLPFDYKKGEEYLIRAAIFGEPRAQTTLAQQLEMYPDAISADEMLRLAKECDSLLPEAECLITEDTDTDALIEEMLTPQYWY